MTGPNEHSAPSMRARRGLELARAAKSLNLGKAVISILVTLAFFTAIVMLLRRAQLDIPDSMKDIIVFMLGVLSTNFNQVVNHWLGTSADSSQKDQLSAAIAPPQPPAPPA